MLGRLVRTVYMGVSLATGLAAGFGAAWSCVEPPADGGARSAPASPAARCLRDFLATVNDPTPEKVRAFEQAWASSARLGRTPVEERVPRIAALHQKWGAVTQTGASAGPDGPVTVAARGENGVWLELTVNMSSAEAGKMDSIEIEESAHPIERRPLAHDLRAQTVRGVADALRANYVFPDKGATMADAILATLASGGYDAIGSEAALARRLTEDCRAITRDRHLGIRATPLRDGADGEAMMGPPDAARRGNYGFKRVEVLEGNIGYVRFDGFFEGDDARRVASDAMSFVCGCDAIIFDLRHNGGGSPDMVRYITSYLFEEKTHLNDMVDRDGKVVEEYWTVTDVPGPRPAAGVPVYVLTSSYTFSGAEEFCYNLKNLKRATIVGETTGGGAHPVRGERVNDRFVALIPFMRARNPVSKTNWEGTGVEPDVKVPGAAALEKAAELARGAVRASRSPGG